MTDRTWTLSTWLRDRIAILATAPVLIAFVVGGLFVQQSISRELRALVREELDEADLALVHAPDPIAEFPAVAARLERHHPSFPMSWRLRDPATKRVIGDYGATDEVERNASPELETVVVAGRTAAGRRVIHGLDVEVFIDGEILTTALSWYWIVALGITSATALIAVACGRWLGRRVGLTLAGMAEHVKAERAGSRPSNTRPLPTEIRSVANELRDSLQAVRESAEHVRVFTGSLAHELRSPIQNLVASTEVALLRERDPGEYRATLTDHLEDLMELGHAVNNLLAFCAAPGESTASRPESFDLARECELRLRHEFERARRDGIRVEATHEGDTTIAADRESILRAVRNIIANAIDWSPDEALVRVEIVGDGDRVRVRVSDQGPGVAPDTRPHIFDPFFRREGTKRRRAGYGLGLAIARAAMDAHGGTITFTDNEPRGSVFELSIPRTPNSAFDTSGVTGPRDAD